MKIVFFTNKSAPGAKILEEMKRKNILVEAIFIDIESSAGLEKRGKNLTRTLKRLGLIETLKIIFEKKVRRRLAPMELKMVSENVKRAVAPRAREAWLSNDFYQSYSKKVYIVDDFNGKQCEQLLREIEPDVIVLGGSRIIRKNIINIPKIGILNAHPGLLPKYRGVDVIPWAIYYGDAIGVTVHFVDEGIDTGGIIAQKAINITEGDTIDSLGKKAQILAAELIAETLLRIIERGHIPVIPQSREDGKQYYRMPMKLFQETKRKLGRMIDESKRDNGKGSPHS